MLNLCRKLILVPIITPFTLALAISGCGGGGGSGGDNASADDNLPGNETGTETAFFKDNNVAGLTVTIDGQSQLTDNQGRFQYTPGDRAEFSVGSVVLGEATVASVVTLVDLVPGASTDDPALINRARFLQLLDANQNPDDGITINPTLRDAAGSWNISSFSDTNQFQNEVAGFLSEVRSVVSGANLPSTEKSSAHIRDTQLCTRAGAYTGSYTGDEDGRFAMQVDSRTGSVSGLGIANGEDVPFTLSGNQPIALTSSGDFISGSVDTGASFDGNFTGPDSLEGNWSNQVLGLDGQFSGRRVGGDFNANYRYTGTFTGSDHGLFAFDISQDGTVTGIAYSGSEGESSELSGTLDGTRLSAAFNQGDGSIEGILDLSAGTLSGSWVNSAEGTSGMFSGDGCSLNPVNSAPLEDPMNDGEDNASGGDNSGDQANELLLLLDDNIINLTIPYTRTITFGVATDTSLVSARAEWISAGETIITEELPILSNRTDSCNFPICLQTSLKTSEARGPTTLTLTVENAAGETATRQEGPFTPNAGPFNGEWIGETVQSSNCGDDGVFGTSLTILQGSETSAAIYGITPNGFGGSISGGVLSANPGRTVTTNGGILVDLTDLQLTLVGDDRLEGSASFDGFCSGSFSLTATRG